MLGYLCVDQQHEQNKILIRNERIDRDATMYYHYPISPHHFYLLLQTLQVE